MLWRSIVTVCVVLALPNSPSPTWANEFAGTVDFDTDIIPVLTQSGCNAGACHGAAIGRGGFKLSLWGSRPDADYASIVRDLEGRRVNLIDAGSSLMLRKPSEQMDHGGGLVLDHDSLGFEAIRRWIEQGAQRLDQRHLVSLSVAPTDAMVDGVGSSVDINVIATFNQGTAVNVTRWCVIKADDPSALHVDAPEATESAGRSIEVLRRGVHGVVVRYLDQVLPIRIGVAMTDQAVNLLPTDHPIDTLVNAELMRVKLAPSRPAGDAAFVRRVWLDLAGRLPSADEVRRFMADRSPNKRDRLIDKRLNSDDFAVHWAMKWSEALGVNTKALQPEGAAAIQNWLTHRLRDDAGFDQTARLMLTSVGDGHQIGPVNFIRLGASPGDLARRTSTLLMGTKLECAECHDHPLDRWTQEDYHGLAAIFAKLDRGRVVSLRDRGEVTDPVTGEPARAKVPGEDFIAGDVDPLARFSDWLTSPQNQYFPRAAVNRIWRHLMGRGLIEPVDDLRSTRVATNPELLDFLANDFASHGFRIKHSIRLICSSAAYQRAGPSMGNRPDTVHYSHALSKPLEPKVLADAIADVTGIPFRSPQNNPIRVVAMTEGQPTKEDLSVLGVCQAPTVCESSASQDASLSKALHWINGDMISGRISDPRGMLHRLLNRSSDDREVLNELLMITLARPELANTDFWSDQLQTIEGRSANDRSEFFEDVFWGLITSDAFSQNR